LNFELLCRCLDQKRLELRSCLANKVLENILFVKDKPKEWFCKVDASFDMFKGQ